MMIESLALALTLTASVPAAAPSPAAKPAPASAAAAAAPEAASSAAQPASSSQITVDSIRSMTDALIAAFKSVKRDDGKLTDAEKKANAKAYAELDEMLARTHFSDAVIAPRKDKFSAAELKKFQDLFWDIVQRIAYPGSGEFFREGVVKIAVPREKNGVWTHDVNAYIPSEDMETLVGLQWKSEGGKLRIIDVLFDGDSLVKDYQNQFSRMIDKEGVAGLLKKLEEKQAELKKTGGTAK